MAGGTHTPEQREAAIEAASQLMDIATPSQVIAITIQREHHYSRAQAYRILAEAGERRGQQGISARPSGSDLAAMAQLACAQALAQATLEGDVKSVGRLARELRETLRACGAITSAPAPDEDPDAIGAQQAHAMRQVASNNPVPD